MHVRYVNNCSFLIKSRYDSKFSGYSSKSYQDFNFQSQKWTGVPWTYKNLELSQVNPISINIASNRLKRTGRLIESEVDVRYSRLPMDFD